MEEFSPKIEYFFYILLYNFIKRKEDNKTYFIKRHVFSRDIRLVRHFLIYGTSLKKVFLELFAMSRNTDE
jgi:hypothetical protein